jgi:hypothetical protein
MSENVETPTESQEKNWAEYFLKAQSVKDEGNKFYSDEKMDEAIEKYTNAIEIMTQEIQTPTETTQENVPSAVCQVKYFF